MSRRISRKNLRETFSLFAAASTVMVLAQTVYSQQTSPVYDDEERSFAGDRRPGILEEPSETPTGPNAELYAEIERDFDDRLEALDRTQKD